MTGFATLREVARRNRDGERVGIPSWCTAHPETLKAILRAHRDSPDPILIEATCNQVNQDGGYTGMTPDAFRRFVEGLAGETGIDTARIVFGGDHLGPNPWKHLPATEAMAKAKAMVEAYARAGFEKIHLDASMALADDGALSEETMTTRAAALCVVAEAARGETDLAYVIGTEVPIPGGETESLDALGVTTSQAVERTYALHRAKFKPEAFERVIAMVVQPGVDFGNSEVYAFDPAKASALAQSAATVPNIVFEAHSTDYQSETALAGLVESHFAVLKVGPELTFAFREAVVAMAEIERKLNLSTPSNILQVISEVMDADPRHWRNYVDSGDETTKLFGLSDRVRYYWPNPRIAQALRQLRENIDNTPIAPGLLWQYVGALDAEFENLPLTEHVVQTKVGAVVKKYRRATSLPSP